MAPQQHGPTHVLPHVASEGLACDARGARVDGGAERLAFLHKPPTTTSANVSRHDLWEALPTVFKHKQLVCTSPERLASSKNREAASPLPWPEHSFHTGLGQADPGTQVLTRSGPKPWALPFLQKRIKETVFSINMHTFYNPLPKPRGFRLFWETPFCLLRENKKIILV